MRPAFSAKCGSRGKIQQRCCQGLIASSFSQRQIVVPLIDAPHPDLIAPPRQDLSYSIAKGACQSRRQLTGKCLNLNDHVWGEKPEGGPGVDVPPGRRGVSRRIFCAIARQLPGVFRGAGRFHHSQRLRLQAGSFWHAGPDNTATYISEPRSQVLLLIERQVYPKWACLASLAGSLLSRMPSTTMSQ